MHPHAAIYKQDRYFMGKNLIILGLNLFEYKKNTFFLKKSVTKITSNALY
jgi:hypothetical protein